jgi:hypothetical protein
MIRLLLRFWGFVMILNSAMLRNVSIPAFTSAASSAFGRNLDHSPEAPMLAGLSIAIGFTTIQRKRGNPHQLAMEVSFPGENQLKPVGKSPRNGGIIHGIVHCHVFVHRIHLGSA